MGGRRWFHRRDDICGGNIREFSYASLRVATNDFSRDRLINKGAWGIVYKGVLSDGTIVAVKTEQLRGDFFSTVEVMSHIRHRNINRVIGYCTENNRLLLVSDYAVNGSLYGLLSDPERKESSDFNWDRRAAICIGIARGLCYLHEDAILCVIHRDIKPANILLDGNYIPKITDFDLVKFFYDHNKRELPHSTNRIVGTYGYMDQGYLLNGQYSEKTDVFAFGVVMLEIISGRRVYQQEHEYDESERYITCWASKLVKNDRVMEIIDPVLTEYPMDAVQGFIYVALLCVQRQPNLRPSMQEVSHWLHGLCNSGRVAFTWPDMSLLEIDDQILGIDWQDIEDEGENSILQDEGKVRFTESADSNTDLELQESQIEGAETCTAGEQREQSNTASVSGLPVRAVRLSGSGDRIERLSQTMVFNKHSQNVFPEAVYPPFRTRVYRRLGSRNLYTF